MITCVLILVDDGCDCGGDGGVVDDGSRGLFELLFGGDGDFRGVAEAPTVTVAGGGELSIVTGDRGLCVGDVLFGDNTVGGL